MERTDTIRKSVKRKPPVIRQTLTSIYRIAKANPLLFIDDPSVNSGSGSIDLNGVKLPNSLKPVTRQQLEDAKPDTNQQNTGNSKDSLKDRGKSYKNNIHVKRSVKPVNAKSSNGLPNPMHARARVTNVNIQKKRRSLSADHYERKKNENVRQLPNAKTNSMSNLHKDEDKLINCISPIIEERKVKFLTPVRSNKVTADFTPTPFVRKSSTPYAVAAIAPNHHVRDLQSRLVQWLKKHKKPVESYHHLNCFGLNRPNTKRDEANKENIEEDSIVSTSYENLKIPASNKKKSDDFKTIVMGCLTDLHKLILEGYSPEQSEAWLNVIREKHCYLENEPQYWECRAAIEQNRGNITGAVDFLHTAIVNGAEINSVDECLEQLLQKFSLLNMNTLDANVTNVAKTERARIVNDARNVFKSSIIQFAVQERKMKKRTIESDNEKKFVATPVRRTTRLTPSRFRLTPKVQICSSLQDLDDGVRSNIDFHSNSVLNVRFSKVHGN